MSAAIKQLQHRRGSLAYSVEAANKGIAEIEADCAAQCATLKERVSRDEVDIADIDAALKTLGAANE